MLFLNEDKKGQLVSKTKSSADYSPQNQSKGKNRYERRTKSKLSSSVKHFNSIDMDKFFKADILDVNIDVKGETNTYIVRISFSGILDELHNFMSARGLTDVDRKVIAQSLSRAFNNSDIYFRCSCPDFRYRMSYNATRDGNIIGDPETRPIRKNVYHAGGLAAANYDGSRGPTCKHINLALKDASWLVKVASVIYNYINYMKEHSEREYQKYIYPALYQEPYPEDNVQLDITDITPEETATSEGINVSEYQEIVDDDLANNNGKLSPTTRALIDDAQLSLYKNPDGSYTVRTGRLSGTNIKDRQAELDKIIASARKRGQFKAGNEFRFRKQNKPDENQMSIDFNALEDDLNN